MYHFENKEKYWTKFECIQFKKKTQRLESSVIV